MLLTLMVTPALIWAANNYGLLDHPDERKQHQAAIPLVGGLAMFFGIAMSATWFLAHADVFWGLLAALSIIFGVGFLDDRYELSVRVRFLAQAIAALILALYAGAQLTSLGDLLGFGTVAVGAREHADHAADFGRRADRLPVLQHALSVAAPGEDFHGRLGQPDAGLSAGVGGDPGVACREKPAAARRRAMVFRDPSVGHGESDAAPGAQGQEPVPPGARPSPPHPLARGLQGRAGGDVHPSGRAAVRHRRPGGLAAGRAGRGDVLCVHGGVRGVLLRRAACVEVDAAGVQGEAAARVSGKRGVARARR